MKPLFCLIGMVCAVNLHLLYFHHILATPIAWYTMSRWLANFAYRTAAAGILVLLTRLLTVSWQSWKAAKSNPVEVLKSDY
jgi:hypothetical protein